MAKQKNNVVTHGLSGNVGDLLIFRQTSTGTVVADMPDSIANEGRYDRMNGIDLTCCRDVGAANRPPCLLVSMPENSKQRTIHE